MKYSKKKYNYYSDDERMSYIREYLSPDFVTQKIRIL